MPGLQQLSPHKLIPHGIQIPYLQFPRQFEDDGAGRDARIGGAMSPTARYGLEVGVAVPPGVTAHESGQVSVDTLKGGVGAIP